MPSKASRGERSAHDRVSDSSMVSKWLSSLDSGNRITFCISYIVLFLVMFACMYASFFLAGRTFIWTDDGLTQQYTTFVELGDWMRRFLGNIFVAHTFEVPMWSQELGYGQDYLIWIAGALGNPINWLAVFSDARTAELLLDLTVPITLFLAGLAFTRLALYHRNDCFSTLLGAMVYVFSGSTIVAFNQVFLVYPMVLAPWVVLGVDKIIDGKSPITFIVFVALAGLYSLYNTWMICILLVVYCMVRFAFMPHKTPRLFGMLFAKTFSSLLLGLAISAVLFIPTAEGILSLGRVGLERSWNLFYPLTYYPQFLTGLLKFDYIGSECFIGALSLSVVAVVILFATKKSSSGKVLLTLFIVLSVFILLPFFGRVLNGFAYPNNRWIWAYALTLGYITTLAIPVMVKLNEEAVKRCAIALSCVCIFFIACGMFVGKYYYAALVLLTATALCVLALKGNAKRASMVVSVVLSCAVLFGLWGRDAAGRNVELGESYDMALDGANSLALQLDGNDWRFDALGSATIWRNTSSVIDKNGTTLYNSMYNGPIDDYQTALGLISSPLNFSTSSMDSRTIMEQFAGVRYVITSKSDTMRVPAIYDEVSAGREADALDLVANEVDNVIPLAFLQDKTMSEEDFRSLSPVDAQEALLQAAVLADVPTTATFQPDNATLDFTYVMEIYEEDPNPIPGEEPEIIPVAKMAGDSPMSALRDYGFQTNDSAVFRLDVDIPAGAEAYVVIEDVDYEASGVVTASSTSLDRLAVKLQGIFPLSDNGCMIEVSTKDMKDSVWQTGKDAHLYAGKDTWAFCLGTSAEERSGIDVKFSNPGTYDIGSISVVVEDVAKVDAQIDELCQRGATDIAFDGNMLTCGIDAPSDAETLVVLLPYSAGWTAEVDGVPTEVRKADLGFLGIELSKGSHQVKLAYQTPGLALGAAVSAAGLLCFVGLIAFRLWRKRTHR